MLSIGIFARSIVKAFSAQAGTGVVAIDGKMYDRPHLVQAIKTLAHAGLSEAGAGERLLSVET